MQCYLILFASNYVIAYLCWTLICLNACVEYVLNPSTSFSCFLCFSEESGWQAEAEIDMELFHQASAGDG